MPVNEEVKGRKDREVRINWLDKSIGNKNEVQRNVLYK